MVTQEERISAKPKVNVRFIFNYCNDLAEMQRFYSGLLGLKEKIFNEDDGYLCYQSEGFEIIFFRAEKEIPCLEEWTEQPGWKGGVLKVVSLAIEIPEEMFVETYEILKSEGVKMFKEEPEWRVGSYWGLSVMDPMGNTIEVYTVPKQIPASTIWSGSLEF